VIAALPELLKACVMLAEWSDWPGDAPAMLDEAIDAAKAALLKSLEESGSLDQWECPDCGRAIESADSPCDDCVRDEDRKNPSKKSEYMQ
jgi:hypothetical protein